MQGHFYKNEKTGAMFLISRKIILTFAAGG
jgi:hypothetical protein